MAVAYFAMIYMGTSLNLKSMKEKIVVQAKRYQQGEGQPKVIYLTMDFSE